MKRFVLGLLAANATSAYLAAFLVLLYSPGPFTMETGLDLLKFIPFGTAIMLNFWPPLLIASTLLVLLLGAGGVTASWIYVLGGGLLGIGFAIAVTESAFLDGWVPQLIGLGSGAAGGWIYWRIAIGRTPRNGHAIESG